jgi:hypothetical protein
LAISTRGISQIWLQDKEESRGKKKESCYIFLMVGPYYCLILKISEKTISGNSSNFGAVFSLLLFLAQFFWFMSWTGIFFVTNWQNSQKRN